MNSIERIRLQHFRSYGDQSFTFTDGVNIILGPNASGKTNLLEAILVVARGDSYRVHDPDLIAFDQPWARIDAYVNTTRRSVKLIRGDNKTEKTYDIDGKLLHRLSIERTMPTVLFEPNHLLLLTGSPERRREYIDDFLTRTAVGYQSLLRSYKRTLLQRNRLLKSGHVVADQLFPWNIRLCELAGKIVRFRIGLVDAIQNALGPMYEDLANSPVDVSILYKTAGNIEQYESIMLRHLETHLQTDILRGFTSFGPHREDFEVRFNEKLAQEVASRGELRTVVLCLKIFELQIVEQTRKLSPIFLLDDVFSELDGARREALATHMRSCQTFITTTDADVATHGFARLHNIISTSKVTSPD